MTRSPVQSRTTAPPSDATLAQLVEHRFRKAGVRSSILRGGSMDKEAREKKIAEFEAEMASPDFWSDKNRAQAVIKELNELKAEKEGGGKYDKGGAILTLFSGAGGDDAEDFSAI